MTGDMPVDAELSLASGESIRISRQRLLEVADHLPPSGGGMTVTIGERDVSLVDLVASAGQVPRSEIRPAEARKLMYDLRLAGPKGIEPLGRLPKGAARPATTPRSEGQSGTFTRAIANALRRYQGQWAVVSDGQVVGAADSLEDAISEARATGVQGPLSLVKVARNIGGQVRE